MPALSLTLLKETIREFRADRPMELSAALSYYTLLSLAPLVLVTVSVASLAFGRETVESKIIAEVQTLAGDSGAQVIHTVLDNAGAPASGIVALIIGIVSLLAGATTVFVQLQDALNSIWDVEARPRSSAIWSFVRQRIVSLAMVVGTGFLLLVSLIVSAVLSALGDWAGASLGDSPPLLQAINTLTSLAAISVLLALIFRFLPDAKVAWRAAWLGGLVTSVLFTGGKYLIGLYLGRAAIGSAYGAASSLIVLMVWVYYASLIVLFGSELTHVWSRQGQGHVAPKQHAVAVEPRPRHRRTVA